MPCLDDVVPNPVALAVDHPRVDTRVSRQLLCVVRRDGKEGEVLRASDSHRDTAEEEGGRCPASASDAPLVRG